MARADWDIIAPGLMPQTFNQAEALGAATWLWMHSAAHRNFPLHGLSRLLLPPITRAQFALGSRAGQPVFYIAWARFDGAAEGRYLRRHPLQIATADWASGDRLWITDLVAPFGHAPEVYRWVLREAFPQQVVRALYHRGEERGLRIVQARGRAMPRDAARAWIESHPVSVESQTSSDQ